MDTAQFFMEPQITMIKKILFGTYNRAGWLLI